MAKPKPTPPSAAAIDADVRASLDALGISATIAADTDEAVYEFYVEFCREHRRIPTQVQCGRAISVDQAKVSHACARLVEAGRMARVEAKGRKPGYLPLVARAKP